jgi:hypothetical protein
MNGDLSARISLLDNQIVDRDEIPIGRVDDVELAIPDGRGPARVTALLTGSQALGERIGGGIGDAMAKVSARLRSPSAPQGPTRLDPDLIEDLEPLLKLKVPLRDLDQVAGLERWLTENVMEKLPGGGHADL